MLGVAIVALYAAATAVAVDRGRPPGAGELLARAQDFVRDARTVEVTGAGKLEGAGAATGDYYSHGEVVFPDRYHLVTSVLDTWFEELVVGHRAWVRTAVGRAELDDEQWVPLAGGDPGIVGPAAGFANIGPTAVRAFVLDAHDPEVASRSDGHAVLAVDSQGERLRLTMATGGRVERIGFGTTLNGAGFRGELRLARWDARQRIEPPPDADVDPTPGIDEEDVAAYRDAPLFQPRGIPDGWALDTATVVPADESVEDCDQVELDYLDPDDDENGYLTIYEMPPDCPDHTPIGGTPFTAGPHAGSYVEEDGELQAEIVIGGTLVQVQTDLPPSDLAIVLADLLPLDLGVTPAPLPGLGKAARPA